jgi:hypothetical protein
MTIANQFSGLDMEMLIGGPLKAACDAQVRLSHATADFINSIGFYTDASGQVQPRQANFVYYKPVITTTTDNSTTPPTTSTSYQASQMTLTVPFLALVKVPSLSIKTVDITFDMEVKETSTDTSGSASSLTVDASASYGGRLFKASIDIKGSISSHQEHTRSTDNSAKYHVELHAADDGPPEGLMRVLDMLQSAMGPIGAGTAADASTFTALQGSGVADTQGPAHH